MLFQSKLENNKQTSNNSCLDRLLSKLVYSLDSFSNLSTISFLILLFNLFESSIRLGENSCELFKSNYLINKIKFLINNLIIILLSN